MHGHHRRPSALVATAPRSSALGTSAPPRLPLGAADSATDDGAAVVVAVPQLHLRVALHQDLIRPSRIRGRVPSICGRMTGPATLWKLHLRSPSYHTMAATTVASTAAPMAASTALPRTVHTTGELHHHHWLSRGPR